MNVPPADIVLDLPFGRFGIHLIGTQIREMQFLPPDTPLRAPREDAAQAIVAKIHAWLGAPSHPLQLPLCSRGTPFQRRVWHALTTIPAGQVKSYGTLAAELDTAARAVGQACGANPFPLAIPCHRVVGANGIGGFAHASDGYLILAKRWLLANEAP